MGPNDQGVPVVVDVANVMGSRPDGWWRDRAGAASRLYDQVAALGSGEWIFVLEGRAKTARISEVPNVRVVLAPGSGSGDDAIADVARSLHGHCLVVTADRELRRRCEAEGATVTGPGWLLRQL
jgi:hypothetical protein